MHILYIDMERQAGLCMLKYQQIALSANEHIQRRSALQADDLRWNLKMDAQTKSEWLIKVATKKGGVINICCPRIVLHTAAQGVSSRSEVCSCCYCACSFSLRFFSPIDKRAITPIPSPAIQKFSGK